MKRIFSILLMSLMLLSCVPRLNLDRGYPVISFTGCVYDKETQEPIKNASILVAYKDHDGFYLLIRPGRPDANRYYTEQEVKTGNDGCFYLKTSNELENLLQGSSVSNRRIAVFASGYTTFFFDLKGFIKKKNKPIYVSK